MRQFAVAVIQDSSSGDSSFAAAQHASELIARTFGAAAPLIVLPEGPLGGRPQGADFGTRVGPRSAEGPAAFAHHAGRATECRDQKRNSSSLAWAEGRAPLGSSPSADTRAKTGPGSGGGSRSRTEVARSQDWRERAKPSRHDAANSITGRSDRSLAPKDQ